MMRIRLLIGVVVASALVLGGVAATASTGRATTPTIRGMVGGDFDTQLPAGSLNGADWGVDASFQRPADNLIHDTDVKVVGTGSGDSADFTGCNGTAAQPTAPRGKVCVYLIGSGGATNIRGVTPVPGTGGSRFGFKLIWD